MLNVLPCSVADAAPRFFSSLRLTTCLKSLVLRQCGLEDTTVYMVTEVLASNSSLIELDLRDNQIDSDDVDAIANALNVNDHLKTLLLGGNFEVGDDGCSRMAEVLGGGNSAKGEDGNFALKVASPHLGLRADGAMPMLAPCKRVCAELGP